MCLHSLLMGFPQWVVSECIAASGVSGNGRGGTVIYMKRRFLGLKQYGEKSLCGTVAVLSPFHIHAERDKRAVLGRPYLACWG